MKKILSLSALLVLAFALGGCGGKLSVDPSAFISVSYDGYDSLGSASYEFDYKHFIREYEDDLKLTSAGKKVSEDLEDEAKDAGFRDSAADMLAVYVNGSLNKTEGLSNGDTITWEWDIDLDKVNEYFNCEILADDVNFTVEGLTEAEAFDPFEGLTISFTGTAPNGQATLSDYNSAKCSGVYFELDKNNGLSNGDTVKVSAKSYGDDLVNYVVENYGMLPTESEKEFTVEGLPEYILNSADVSDETLDKMKKQAEDVIDAGAANWYDSSELLNKEYIGNYFLTPKNPDSYGEQNAITLVYRLDVKQTYNYNKTDWEAFGSIYVGYSWRNLMRLEDGTESFDLSSYTKREPYSNAKITVTYKDKKGKEYTRDFYFSAYPDLDSMFNDLVTKNVENYNYENNVKDTEPDYGAAASEEGEDGEETTGETSEENS